MIDQAVAEYAARPVNAERLAALKKYAGRRLLDVGCGNGAYVTALRPEHATAGVDRATLPSWAEHPSRFVVGSADALPFADRSFNTVSCFETLEHLDDPARGLLELARVARDTVVLTVPNCEISPGQRTSGLIFHHWFDPTHRNFWTHDEFIAFVKGHGLDIVEAYRINHIDLRALIAEAYTRRRWTTSLLWRALRLVKHRPYGMTTLVVARPLVRAT